MGLFQMDVVDEIPDRRHHDLGRKRQRGDYRPRGEGAIVRSVRDAARHIVEELSFDAIQLERRRPRTVARRNPPAVLAVKSEFPRIADAVLLLHIGGTAAVLKVVEVPRTHVVVLNPAEVYPDV